MKKPVFVFLSLALLLVILTACGKVDHAKELISEIGEVTVESASKIEAAEAAVEELNDKQLEKVDNLATLSAAKEQYEIAVKTQKENNKKINNVEERISKIGEISADSVCRIKIENARYAYDALDPELQESVNNYDVLTAAENTYSQLAITAITDAINDIGTVSLDRAAAITAARKAYDKYSADIQEQVENRDTLFSAEEQLVDLQIAYATECIGNIGTVTTESADVIATATAAFNAVPVPDRTKIENRGLLTKARDAYKELLAAKEREKAIEEARNLIRVTKVDVSAPDSAGGVELYFNFINNSEKTIKYVYFAVTFYNSVGDVVSGKYNYGTINRCQDTGPFETGEGRTGTWWHWGDYYNWEIKSVKLVELSIEYMDGTTVTLTKDQVDGVQY